MRGRQGDIIKSDAGSGCSTEGENRGIEEEEQEEV